MLNQRSFLFKSSSFNLAILIGFKSHLCSEKQILKHLPVSPIYTPEQSLQGILQIAPHLYDASTESFSGGKIFLIIL